MARKKNVSLNKKEFEAQLNELAASLRRSIEAEQVGFDPSQEAVNHRREAVRDPVNGFRYFVQNYFPHYIRHKDESELHKFLFQRLPEIVSATVSQQDAIAAPRGEAKSTIVSQLFVLWCIILELKNTRSSSWTVSTRPIRCWRPSRPSSAGTRG